MTWRTLVVPMAVLLAGCVGQVAPTGGVQSPAETPSSADESATPSPTATPATPSTAYPFTPADLPVIDGSTANIPLISLALQRLTGVSADEADAMVDTTGTPSAYRRLAWGDADLLIVYEADASVLAEVKADGVKLELHPIGRDALVFFTNSSNPVTSLTTGQYRRIYTGRITNWSQVGGSDEPIVAYQRPEESGSQTLLRKYVVGDATLAKGPSDLVKGEMGEIIAAVSDYANTGNALGYSVYYYLSTMYAVDGIRMLGVSGVQPGSDTIADGSYPYTNDFYAVVRADEPAGSPARRVLEWLLSAEGEQTVADAGYVAVHH